jgi:hypothetical protein
MSSDNQPPTKLKHPFDFDWDAIAIAVLKGVVVMTIRVSLVLSSALILATMVPAVGLADQPEVMQQVDVEILLEAEAEGTTPEGGGLKAWAFGVAKKAAVGAGNIRDNLLDVDESMREEMAQQKATIIRLKADLVEAENARDDARYRTGVQHERMLSCSKDLLEYLSDLKSN